MLHVFRKLLWKNHVVHLRKSESCDFMKDFTGFCIVGDKESKQVLDAFFLGKAFAETVNERVGTVIGEILSDIGRRQAEQQKHIREFQVAPLNSPLWTQIPNGCFIQEYSLNGDSPYGCAWFLLSLSFC
jgi:hypothetical protein